MLSISFIVIGYACTLAVANNMISGSAFGDPFSAGGHNYFVRSSFSGKSAYSPPVAKHYNPSSAKGHAYNPVPAPPKYNPSPSGSNHANIPAQYFPRYNSGPHRLNSPRGSPTSIYPASESYNPLSGGSYVNVPSPPSYDQVAPSYNPPAQPSSGSPSSNPSGKSYGREPAPPSHSYEKDASSSQNGFIPESFLFHSGHDRTYKDTKPSQYEIPVLHHRISGGTKHKGRGRSGNGKQQVY